MAVAPEPGQRMLSRRSLLKGGSALVVALGVSGSGGAAAGSALAEASPFDSNGSPDLMQADSYLVIHADSTAAVKTGRVELGQGSMTGLLLLAAEELDMDLGQLEFVRHDTNVTPNTGGTFGSSSISVGGQKLRAAAAAARQALLGLASASRFRR
jgi:nicotinate dehydrogenase subunit B